MRADQWSHNVKRRVSWLCFSCALLRCLLGGDAATSGARVQHSLTVDTTSVNWKRSKSTVEYVVAGCSDQTMVCVRVSVVLAASRIVYDVACSVNEGKSEGRPTPGRATNTNSVYPHVP